MHLQQLFGLLLGDLALLHDGLYVVVGVGGTFAGFLVVFFTASAPLVVFVWLLVLGVVQHVQHVLGLGGVVCKARLTDEEVGVGSLVVVDLRRLDGELLILTIEADLVGTLNLLSTHLLENLLSVYV